MGMVDVRKIITTREIVLSELGVPAPRAVVRAVGMAVIRNPFAGRFVDDLQPLFEAGVMLGGRLMPGQQSPTARARSSASMAR
jgi:Amino acid synthesis